MDSNNKVVKGSDALYYLAYFLLIFQSMTRWVLIDGIAFISEACTAMIPILLLLVFIMRNQKIQKNNFLIIILLIGITVVSMKITKGTAIWNIILFIITAKNMNVDKVIKFDFIVKSILIISIYILYINGLTEKVIIYRGKDGLRYGLGFGHPNTFSVYLLGICLDFLYLNFKSKYKKNAYIMIIISILFISKFCDSRSSMYALTITLLLSIFIKNKKIYSNIFSKFPIILLILSFVATIMYKYKRNFPFIISLNEILSNRVLLMYQFYERYSVTLFGNYFIDYHTASTTTASVLDNSYILLLTKFGIIITLIIILSMSKIIKKAFEDDNLGLVVCIIAFSFFGLMENGLIVLFYNPFLLFLANLIFKNKKQEELNEDK